MRQSQIFTTAANCRIVVDEKIKKLDHYLKSEKNIIITDRNVRRIYGSIFSDYEVVEIGLGEQSKTLQAIEWIYRAFLSRELDRSSFAVGIGGGIVCDVTGFVASTYMRGIRFGFVPTTLLAQVDASIGGKNGVNLDGFKNIIGVFNQPEFILLDFDVLRTLPEEEFLCGIAEVVKHAAVASPSLFAFLENQWEALLSQQKDALQRAVIDSIKIKSRIVDVDEKEIGERRRLNFGHTLGHALEKVYGLSHGKSVSIGMVLASKISVSRGLISEDDAFRVERLLRNFGLPARTPSNPQSLIEAVKKDKKRQGNAIHFVLLEKIGKAKVQRITYKELEELINDLCKHS